MRAIAAIAVISALLATSAFASDFRVLDFGSPCAEAVELEEALGAEPIPSQSGPNQQTFRGRVFDHEATILYLCPDGGSRWATTLLYCRRLIKHSRPSMISTKFSTGCMARHTLIIRDGNMMPLPKIRGASRPTRRSTWWVGVINEFR